ncbi:MULTISPECIES: iron-containing redox enzyme family protein [Streptacidiphilus]|uniref:Iron-containing redox enzyme family protein n=1 Tax=Streptacidiphilus cavernicola TaxID=3342716 RepID=A0ABV6UX81_9ACTN|nr:iron-containing redox enzyme family protein [Streptacidiphilus jeojiense]
MPPKTAWPDPSKGRSAKLDRTRARTAYAAFADPEDTQAEAVPLAEIRAELERSGVEGPTTPDLAELCGQAGTWSRQEALRYRELAARAAAEDAGLLLAQSAALGCAPLALLSGAWLQWLSGMANADEASALAALTLYASDVGVGHPRNSRGAAYLQVLQALQVAEFAVPAARTALDLRIGDEAFSLPALLLLMGRRPDDLHPEILGADLCLRRVGLLPPLVAVMTALPAAAWDVLDPGQARSHEPHGGTAACQAAITALCTAVEDDRDAGRRVAAGFSWAFTALRAWNEGLHAELVDVFDPARQAAELIRIRAREGSQYHQKFKLAGRQLSSWLQEARTDPFPLLAELAKSSLVKPGRPDRSPLVNGLVSERGSMFRVFSEADLAVLRRWIGSLPTSDGEGTTARAADGRARSGGERPGSGGFDLPLEGGSPADGTAPADLREAYFLLQRRGQQPAVRRYALQYVHGWLGRARHGLARTDCALPPRWPEEGLRPWLAEQHDRHAEQFEATAEAELPSREELIESTVQLAPLTMIDGAWLQGFTDYELASSDIGHSLFETYWDELGNGRLALNHPLIYRELVAGMGVELPPTGSVEFARWPGFLDSSFELPVFWLSIGRFPQTFQPEVLGLNLAMELSGVGGTYRRARLGLRKYGFSTRFVDIHNTIDNVATGHSAWAADAIDSFMSAAASNGGGLARDAAWGRIREGYRSLNPPTGIHARLADRRARRVSRSR